MKSSFIQFVIAAAVILGFAVILFPVFAQSKEAAKKTSEISMRKQREMAAAIEAEERGLQTVSRENVKSLMDERMVIRTANISVRVDDVERAEQSVNRIVRQHGGYVTEAQSSNLSSDYPSMTITMRVPVESFEDILSGLEGLGTRLNKGVSSKDVTEEVVDLDARMKTMAIQEETYRGLLRGARDMGTIMSLQDKLAEIRSTIESLQAQRTSLAKQAAYSTITMTLEQAAVGNAPPKDPNWLAQTWGESTTSMGAFTRTVVVGLVWLLVYSPVWLLLGFVALRVRKLRSQPLG